MKAPKRQKESPTRQQHSGISIGETFEALAKNYPHRVYRVWKSYPIEPVDGVHSYPEGDQWMWVNKDDAQVIFVGPGRAIMHTTSNGYQSIRLGDLEFDNLFKPGTRTTPLSYNDGSDKPPPSDFSI